MTVSPAVVTYMKSRRVSGTRKIVSCLESERTAARLQRRARDAAITHVTPAARRPAATSGQMSSWYLRYSSILPSLTSVVNA